MYALLFVLMLRLGCQPLLCWLLLVRASVPRLGRVAPTTMLNSGTVVKWPNYVTPMSLGVRATMFMLNSRRRATMFMLNSGSI